MPLSGDQTILTGAADCKIRVHDIAMNEPKMVCSCHANRVKRLAIAPNDANLFWSAAEDGTIMSVNLHVKFFHSVKCALKIPGSLISDFHINAAQNQVPRFSST
jgi:WD40 repeat protein